MKSMRGWTSSLAATDCRGFTHPRGYCRGITHPTYRIVAAFCAVMEALVDACPVDNCRFSGFWASQASGFHTPQPRGITHHSIGVSHTESRGFTHQPFSEHPRKPSFFGSFFQLNLLNDSYLTESLNHLRRRWVTVRLSIKTETVSGGRLTRPQTEVVVAVRIRFSSSTGSIPIASATATYSSTLSERSPVSYRET